MRRPWTPSSGVPSAKTADASTGIKGDDYTTAQRAVTAAENDQWLVPYRAADFAFQNNRMDEAQKWLDQAMKERENIATLWLQARMQAKRGDRAAAIKTAEAALAKAGPNDTAFAGEIKKISDTWR